MARDPQGGPYFGEHGIYAVIGEELLVAAQRAAHVTLRLDLEPFVTLLRPKFGYLWDETASASTSIMRFRDLLDFFGAPEDAPVVATA